MTPREFIVFAIGDPAKASTWSNVPYFLSKTLEEKGHVVHRADLAPNRPLLMDHLVHPMVGKLHSIKNAWAVLLIIIACLITLIFLIRKNMDRFRTRPWFVKAEKLITGVINGVRTVAKMKRNGLFIAHTFFIWAMYFFMTYFCFFALDSTSHLGLKAGMFVLVIGGLGMSAPVQGGIGAYHWIVSQGLLLFNINLKDGIVFATLVHTSQTILVIILGLLSLFMLFLTGKKPVGHEKK